MYLFIPLLVTGAILMWLVRPNGETIHARKKPLLLTIVPSFILALAIVIIQVIERGDGISDIANGLFIAGIVGIVLIIGAMIFHYMKRHTETVKGLTFGLTFAILLSITEVFVMEWLGA